MKKTRETNTGGALQNKTVTVVYPVPNVKINPQSTTNWQQLCAQLRDGASIATLLDTYAQLDPDSLDVARLFAWAYRYQYGLQPIDVLRGHGALFNACHYNGADFDVCANLASIDARLKELEAKS